MRRILTVILGITLLTPLLARAAMGSADAEYEAFQALAKEAPPASFKEMGMEKMLRWMDAHRQALRTTALAFQTAHPTDPRRWEIIMASSKAAPFFISSLAPDVGKRGMEAITADEAALAEWKKRTGELTQALLASSDASSELREEAEWSLFAKDFRAVSAAKAKGAPFDYGPFRSRFDVHIAKYAQLDVVATRAVDYLGALERNLPGSSKEVWEHLLNAPNAALRERAAAQMTYSELMQKPVDLTFMAVDGRRVDLKALRGKVVLVDFWATWCGPCKAELPNVVANYQKYHDKGFEVVGIALENASLAPKDTSEQAAAKVERAKKVLTDFTGDHAMTWPQYYDGKYWKTEIAVKYAITSIPAMFLLDQEGRIVTTDARGSKLEAEVKRLLKL